MKKLQNKGFTLVELIIVVAIIAVLAAVLAPQYLQYVERSRESNDLQVATSIMRATTAAVADPQNNVPSSSDITVTWATAAGSNTGDISVTGSVATANAAILASIDEVMGGENILAESAAGTGVNFSFVVDVATGNITVANASGAWVNTIGVNETVAAP